MYSRHARENGVAGGRIEARRFEQRIHGIHEVATAGVLLHLFGEDVGLRIRFENRVALLVFLLILGGKQNPGSFNLVLLDEEAQSTGLIDNLRGRGHQSDQLSITGHG